MLINQNKFNIANSRITFKSNEAYQSSQLSNVQNPTDLIIQDKKSAPEKLSKAYQSYLSKPPAIGFREIKTFNLPHIGPGKVYQLSNGHKIVILPKSGSTVINTYVKVGEVNDSKDGLTHCLEHIVGINSKFKKIGAEYNAQTHEFYTNYYAQVFVNNSKELENLIKMQADMLQEPDFNEIKVNQEKKIIIAENNLNQIKSATLQSKKRNILYGNLFNTDFRKTTSIENEENINIKDLITHYDTYYKPENMTTIIVGNVDLKDTIKIVTKYFNSEQKNNNIVPNNFTLPLCNLIKSTKRIDLITSDMAKPAVHMAFIGPKNNDVKENWILQLFAKIPDQPFIFKKEEISSNPNDPQIIYLKSFHSNTNEQNLKNIYSYISRLSKTPLTLDELTKMKEEMKDNISIMNEQSFYLSESIASCMTEDDINISFLANSSKVIDSITPKDIQDFSRKYLDLNKASILVESPLTSPSNKSFKTASIGFKGNVNRLNNQIDNYNLPNNLNLIVDHSPNITRTTIDYTLYSNIPLDTKPATRLILNAMLSSSIHNNKNDLANIENTFGFNGLSEFPHISKNSLYCSINCRPEKTLSAISFLKNVLYDPKLNMKEFTELKEYEKYVFNFSDKYLVIEQNIDKEFKIDKNKDGDSNEEISQNLDKVTFEDVKKLYNQIISNSQGQIVLTMPNEEWLRMKDKILKSFNQGIPIHKSNAPTLVNSNLTPLQNNIIFVKPTNGNQAQIVQSFKIIETQNMKDHIALCLLDKILGCPSYSMLKNKFRTKEGISYAVNSNYNAENQLGKLNLEVETSIKNDLLGDEPDNVHKVIDGFREIINSLIIKPVNQDTLNIVKAIYKNELAKKIETSNGRNELVKEGLKTPYGARYIDALLETIDEIQPEDIQRAAKQYLDKPSVLSITANKETLAKNKDYLQTFGEIKELNS